MAGGHACADFAIPAPGEVTPIADGVLWARFALPFRLNHVNAYFLRDGRGWAVVDTGVNDAATRASWQRLLEGPLRDGLTRIIATHAHPDHVGLAAWLCDTQDIPLHIHPVEHAAATHMRTPAGADILAARRQYLEREGFSPAACLNALHGSSRYADLVAPLPELFQPLDENGLILDAAMWETRFAAGHSPALAMLLDRSRGLFLAADQVLASISPNVGISVFMDEGNPLADFLCSLKQIEADIPSDALVLPGHGVPFYGLHQRTRALRAHHEERLKDLALSCSQKGMSRLSDLLPVFFERDIPPEQTSFALTELRAHLSYLAQGECLESASKERVLRATGSHRT